MQGLTLASMCTMLTSITKEAVQLYLREGGMKELAYMRLEALLRTLMGILSDQEPLSAHRRNTRLLSTESRKRQVENGALLRQVTATLSSLLVGLLGESGSQADVQVPLFSGKVPFYLLVSVSGFKPPRFLESTTLPTFLDWNVPCVSRVSQREVDLAIAKQKKCSAESLKKFVCLEFAEVLRSALELEMPTGSVEICTDFFSCQPPTKSRDPAKTYLDLTVLHTSIEMMEMETSPQLSAGILETKRFFYRKHARPDSVPFKPEMSDTVGPYPVGSSTIIEVTVAHSFPSILSRQRALLTSEIGPLTS